MPGAFRFLPVRAAASVSTFDDSANSNRILAVVSILLVVGVGLLIFSFWYWRSTRPEPEALAPLELLGTRKLRKVTPEERRAALDRVRPPRPGESTDASPEPELPPLDLAAHAARDLPPLTELAPPPSPAPPSSPAPLPPPVSIAAPAPGPAPDVVVADAADDDAAPDAPAPADRH